MTPSSSRPPGARAASPEARRRNPDQPIDFIARRLLARPFRPEELAVVQTSLAKLRAIYQSHPDEAAELLTVGESKAETPRARDPRRLDHAGERVDEPG